MDEVAENSDELMERYLEGEEIDHDEIVTVAEAGRHRRQRSSRSPAGSRPRTSAPRGCWRRWSRTCPRRRCGAPSRRSDEDGEEIEIEPDEDGEPIAYVFKTLADPYAGRLNLFRVYSGVLKGDSQVTNVTQRAKERIGQLLIPRGKEHEQTSTRSAPATSARSPS